MVLIHQDSSTFSVLQSLDNQMYFSVPNLTSKLSFSSEYAGQLLFQKLVSYLFPRSSPNIVTDSLMKWEK